MSEETEKEALEKVNKAAIGGRVWYNPIDIRRRGLEGGILKLLTEEGVTLIQEGAEKILSAKPYGGIECKDDETREIMKKGEAEVDDDKKRIWLSQDLIREYIAKAPSRVILGARDPQHDLDLGGHRVYCGSGGAPTQIVRLPEESISPKKLKELKSLIRGHRRVNRETFEAEIRKIFRETVSEYHLQDLINTARLAQGTKNIMFYLRSGEPLDLAEGIVRDANKVYYALQNTVKHVMAGYFHSAETLRETLKIPKIIAGSEEEFRKRPLLSVVICLVIPPRRVDKAVAGVFIEGVRQGAPVAASADPIMGLTTPPTRAALLTQLHAEQLFAIVLAQMVKEGAPVLPGYVVGVGNMLQPEKIMDPSGYHQEGRYRGFLGGTIEGALLNAAVAQLAHSPYLDVPVYNTAGLSDSKASDVQIAIEKAISVLLSVMTGVNYIHHAAGFRKDMSEISDVQYIIDAEIIGMCMEVLNGIEVNEKTLMLDAILGKDPGKDFLDVSRFTARRIRKGTETEFYFPSAMMDRADREDWEAAGAIWAHKRAEMMVREILKKAESIPFSPEVEKKIRREFKGILVKGGRNDRKA